MEISNFHIKYTIGIVVFFLILIMVECHRSGQEADRMQYAIDSLQSENDHMKMQINDLQMKLHDVSFDADQPQSQTTDSETSNRVGYSNTEHKRKFVSPNR